MSEADVSLIHDEDVLRRMWQQTEDFSRKKEIRAHMYKLREERLRNLYSPEPGVEGKGCEFSTSQGHVKSFADQTFQSMKSKEVRDAGSPPKEFTYRGQDLKELSNAGWNVESENKTIDDGRTHIKSVHADIEGRYDVEGGHGQFAAVDHHKQAVTEYNDGNTSLKRNENFTNTAAHEQVIRRTDDGTQFSSTTNSSSSSSKFHQVSSTQEKLPYIANDDCEQSVKTFHDSNQKQSQNVSSTRERIVTRKEVDHNKVQDYEHGELTSRKIDYPDENTKVIVETRTLPDGSKVTSTRREFRAPVVQTSHSQQHSEQTKSENKYSSHSTHKQSQISQSSSKTVRETSDVNSDIVDVQRNRDEYDFHKKISCKNFTENQTKDISNDKEPRQEQDYETTFDDSYRNETITSRNSNKNNKVQHKKNEEHFFVKDDEDRAYNITQDNRVEEIIENKTSTHQYQTTYQSDFTQRKVSNDLSPAHQAWASTLRSDTPNRPHTRASSPGAKTYQSSTSSLRSSVSPDKTFRKPNSRGGSPTKLDRSSPTRTISDRRSSSHSTYSFTETRSDRKTSTERRSSRLSSPTNRASSPEKTPLSNMKSRASTSPEKRSPLFNDRQRATLDKDTKTRATDSYKKSSMFDETEKDNCRRSPERKPNEKEKSPNDVRLSRNTSPHKTDKKLNKSPDRKQTQLSPTETSENLPKEPSSIAKKQDQDIPGYMKPTAASQSRPQEVERKTSIKYTDLQNVTDETQTIKTNKIKEEHYKFIDEETKMYTAPIKKDTITKTYTTDEVNISVAKHDTINDNLLQKGTRKPQDRSPSPVTPSAKIRSKSPSPVKYPTKTSTSPSRKSPPKDDVGISPRQSLSPTRKGKSPGPNNVTNNTNNINRTSSAFDKKLSQSPRSSPEKYISPNREINDNISENRSEFTKNTSFQDESFRDSNISKYDKTTVFENTLSTNVKQVDDTDSTSMQTFDSSRQTESPQKLSKRTSASPDKKMQTPLRPYTKDDKNKYTSDFINTEKYTEENNKNIISKDRPRQLVTPSSSPTRKPKINESAPSTGQSSPTTSASDFVYFGSSHVDKTMTTDLDVQETYAGTKEIDDISKYKNKSDELKSPTHSKIPCRSPSPEKRPSKESLPRKSSLKKPKDISHVSTTEKPPTSFLVSPTEETKTFVSDKVDKSNSAVKSKPPFERRETYEERCLKILGMMDVDSTTSTQLKEKETISDTNIRRSTSHSPSISPCRSPLPKEVPHKSHHKNFKNSKTDKSELYNTYNIDSKTKKSPSRENSPTKLQSIINVKKDKNINEHKSVIKTEENEVVSSNESNNNSVIKQTKQSTKKYPIDEEDKLRIPVKKTELNKLIKSELEETVTENVATANVENNMMHTTEVIQQVSKTNVLEDDLSILKSPLSSTRQISSETVILSKESKNLPGKSKKIDTVDTTVELIRNEREQEVLDRVQKSLRKLSPKRTTSTPKSSDLHDNIENVKKEMIKDDVRLTQDDSQKTIKPSHDKKATKLPSRNVSPTKKTANITPGLTRSTSPKKPASPTDRPQSPQISKISVPNKVKETSTLPIKKTMSPVKPEKNVVTDSKKFTINNNTKTVKDGVTKLGDQEPKRQYVLKSNQKDIMRKNPDSKVTRTTSDITIKTKKTSPQRIKSKPEIQVNDVKADNKAVKSPTSPLKQPLNKFPTTKPKSATALNTTTDEDDFIVDVQQAKSSRENSPDRICPTPVGFLEDVGTPRFPDQVNEPDDDFQKRTHKIIHEAESIVDDIVEIREDDELFVKTTDIDCLEEDESLLSVNDKVSKFATKIHNVTKPKDSSSTSKIKTTERKVHSDFINESLKSDECLLSVSEKVNKFANVTDRIKDNRSPSRNIVEEYDIQTTYQDDYTKLSVNDKAHLFIETAENVKSSKPKANQKVERPDLSNVDESLKSDDCLLSVSDKVNKFVKTAEQFLSETQEIEEKERKIKEQHDQIMKKILENADEIDFNTIKTSKSSTTDTKDKIDINPHVSNNNDTPNTKVSTTTSNKPTEKSTSKLSTLRSNDAVKKAKALFENIATTTPKSKDIGGKTTKLTDIGVSKKAKTDSSKIQSSENSSVHTEEYNEVSNIRNKQKEINEQDITTTISQEKSHRSNIKSNDKSQKISNQTRPRSPVKSRPKSPAFKEVVTSPTTKTIIANTAAEQDISLQNKDSYPENTDKLQDKIPGYQRPTKTSQLKEETKTLDDLEVSSRRGSGKFGIELRRTSIERSTVSSERRRSSVEHHQPCIEDIFDHDLLEQMLEKVVGYEQRRRIRAQIRVAKKKIENDQTTTNSKITKNKSPERRPLNKSPDRHTKSTSNKHLSPERSPKSHIHKTLSPDRLPKSKPLEKGPSKTNETIEDKTLFNGHNVEYNNIPSDSTRSRSPKKLVPKETSIKSKSPARQTSPSKTSRPLSPSKSPTTKSKGNRFSEYASAYMKKVGLNDSDKSSGNELKTKKQLIDNVHRQRIEEIQTIETEQFTNISNAITEIASSKETNHAVEINGKRSPSPEKKIATHVQTPKHKSPSPERKHVESPTQFKTAEVKQTPDLKQTKKETISKTAYDIEKKISQKQVQEEKPSWVTNRNLKKITSETRTFSTKKIEPEKTKYRAPSPSKVISKPIDVITSSYGPGPLDADGRPLFGIKALRKGASNYQVKGTVIRQEFHSRNGGEPEGTVSVTAYSTEPDDLEKLLQCQGEKPSRLHGLAAITTTKKFGGDTGTTYSEIQNKEERAALEQFTHSDHRVVDSRSSTNNTFERKEQKQSEKVKIERIHDTDERKQYTRDKQEASKPNKNGISKTEKMETIDKRSKVESLDKKTERTERRHDEKKTVRQSSVKSLTEKYIKSANETSKTDRTTYPKAGLILRTNTMKDNVSSDSSAHAGLARTDSEHSLDSIEDVVTTTTTEQIGDGVRTTTTTTKRSGHARTQECSFLDSNTKVTGVQDILTRMKNADIVIEEGDSNEDAEARSLLNKFLGATVLMAGMQSYITEKPSGKVVVKQETVHSSSGKSSRRLEEFDIEQCWDERVLRKLLDECTDYEQRRRLRARIRTVMAEQEACATAVTEALAAAGEQVETEEQTGERVEEEVRTVTSSVRRNSSEKTITTTKNTKVIESMTRPAPKPVSPFAKFRQLEKQNSTNSPNCICGYE